MKKVLLITTAICQESTERDLARLFSSIGNRNDISVKMVLLLQNYEEKLNLSIPSYVDVMKIDNIVSLSKARNLMIQHINKFTVFSRYDVVAFPDDDCWYPKNSFYEIVNYMAENKVDYFVTKYRYSDHDELSNVSLRDVKLKKFLEFSSSITVFISGGLFEKNSSFDEKLGVGAEYLGGEDLDFSLLAYFYAKNRVFANGYLMAHKDRNIKNKVKYFEGSLFVFRKNSNLHPVIKMLLVRKLLVGLYYVIRSKMPLSSYITSLKKVFNHAF